MNSVGPVFGHLCVMRPHLNFGQVIMFTNISSYLRPPIIYDHKYRDSSVVENNRVHCKLNSIITSVFYLAVQRVYHVKIYLG